MPTGTRIGKYDLLIASPEINKTFEVIKVVLEGKLGTKNVGPFEL